MNRNDRGAATAEFNRKATVIFGWMIPAFSGLAIWLLVEMKWGDAIVSLGCAIASGTAFRVRVRRAISSVSPTLPGEVGSEWRRGFAYLRRRNS